MSEYFAAIERGDIEKIKEISSSYHMTVVRDGNGWGPLHIAAKIGNVTVINALRKAGEDIDSRTKNDRYTPLHIATKHGNIDAIKALIEAGANIYAGDNFSLMPMHLAAMSKSANIVKELIKGGVAVHLANKNGFTPLHLAATHGTPDMISALIEAGADVHAVDNGGWTTLHHAANGDNLDAVALLLDHKVAVNTPNQDGTTPLHIAVRKRNQKMISALIAAGADIEVESKYQGTPMHIAARINGIMLVDFALEHIKENKTAEEAMFAACASRFRPIIMTTVAAIMASLPVAIGIGAEADMNRPLGLVIVGGLLFSQLITLYVTPIVFYYMQRFSERVTKPKEHTA